MDAMTGRFAKRRLIFDGDAYYGDEGTEVAVEDLMSRDDMTEDEVRESYSDDQIFEHAMDMMRDDWDLELDRLKGFFDKDSPNNPNAGNHILIRGSAQRWDRTSSGIDVCERIEDLLDCSPARFGRDNIFADCEIDRIWDENGHLFVSGAHHDGRVTVEVRQVSNEAERLVFDKLDYEGDIIDINPVEAMGRRYRDGDERELYHDLWEDADLCPSPRYMEREFECPVLEYERESHDTRTTIRVYPVTPSAIAAYEEGYQFMILGQADGDYLGDLDGYPHKFCKSLGQAQERCESFVAGHWDDERPGYDLDSACREAELAADALAPERQETREIETERGDG